MDILIIKDEKETIQDSEYRFIEIQIDNKVFNITEKKGSNSYVNVRINNAIQKAFRGLGKDFATYDEAINNYKDPKIIAAIEYAKQ